MCARWLRTGLGHAVWCARDIVGDEPFAVILPDMIMDAEPGCTAQALKAYQDTGGGNVIVVEPCPLAWRTSTASWRWTARTTGLPLIVHTRDAEADTAAILTDEMGKGAFTGVIHCFTASAAFAEAALGLGFYISLSGILTFKNARDLQATAGDAAGGAHPR